MIVLYGKREKRREKSGSDGIPTKNCEGVKHYTINKL